MKQKISILPLFLILATLGIALSSCSPASQANQSEPTQAFESALLTATYAIVLPSQIPTQAPPTATTTPTTIPTQTPDPNRTPPPLPGVFDNGTLKTGDTPHTYVQDTCKVLKSRWDPNNSSPGTVVMPIMFHSITDGEVTHIDQIHVTQFNQLMNDLKDQGFEAITMAQFADFMENNAKIPARSVLLIVDDRKRLAYFETHFKPYFDSWGWTLTNAWISAVDTPDYLWQENQVVESAGYVDHQAHGVVHNVPIGDYSTEDYIRSEMGGSIEAIEKYYGNAPFAYIWPGGGFTKQAAEIARELGYRLGFTINPRGPVMFNWVPLAEASDPARPSYIPEGKIGDPLMVLPRYWDTDAIAHIDEVRQLGKAAAAYAQENKQTELEYYDIVCKPVLGPIPPLAAAQ
ncbi:MAG: polysaccharide deacetylase family protein [Anaerolineaceae bacterium]|nr:polysaccharide deacetylase family protein [Anaerolineaceae bacterium]